MSLSSCFASHPGVRREHNEDSWCAREDLGLFVVADGVGGYASGEIASRAAVEAIQQAIAESVGRTERSDWPFDFQPDLGVDGNRLNWAFHQANSRIRAESEGRRDRHGMATTVAAVLFEGGATSGGTTGGGATIGHVGDSRIYRLRKGRLDRLTRDHSWVQEQVQAGRMTDRDAHEHPRRNLLTRALTGADPARAELAWVPVARGDRLLLCSDGLHMVLSDDQIAEILTRDLEEAAPGGESREPPRPPAGRTNEPARRSAADATAGDGVLDETMLEATLAARDSVCQALVHAANLAGGPDNITVILIRV